MAPHPLSWLKTHTIGELATVPENAAWLAGKARGAPAKVSDAMSDAGEQVGHGARSVGRSVVDAVPFVGDHDTTVEDQLRDARKAADTARLAEEDAMRFAQQAREAATEAEETTRAAFERAHETEREAKARAEAEVAELRRKVEEEAAGTIAEGNAEAESTAAEAQRRAQKINDRAEEAITAAGRELARSPRARRSGGEGGDAGCKGRRSRGRAAR